MPRPRKAIPSVVHHKSTGQARVRIGGRDFYLGRYGSQEAREAYVRLLGEIQTAGRETVRMVRDLSDDSSSPTVAELCLAFLDHAEATYRKNGRATSTCSTFKTPIRALRTLYGDTPAKNFGPIALEAVRQLFVDEGVSRGVVNSYAANVRRIFRWGVSRQLVPVSVIQALECLAPLRAGRTKAPERPPVVPVADVNRSARPANGTTSPVIDERSGERANARSTCRRNCELFHPTRMTRANVVNWRRNGGTLIAGTPIKSATRLPRPSGGKLGSKRSKQRSATRGSTPARFMPRNRRRWRRMWPGGWGEFPRPRSAIVGADSWIDWHTRTMIGRSVRSSRR